MSSLFDLVDDSFTDKNTSHSYLGLYGELLESKRNTAQHLLEIGIGDFNVKNGGSVQLWHDYFPNATVYCCDILPKERVVDHLFIMPRVKLYTSSNAYDPTFVKREFMDKGIKFDMMLDDGPHTLDSMKQFIELYHPLLKEDGILMVEDVFSMDWIKELTKVTPSHLKPFIETYDLRANKGRFDDIVFAINKSRESFQEQFSPFMSMGEMRR